MTSAEDKLAHLATRFAARAVDERLELAAALAADDREAMQTRAHKLAGVAAMFGHPAIGEAALALELAAESGEPLVDLAMQLDNLLADLAVSSLS